MGSLNQSTAFGPGVYRGIPFTPEKFQRYVEGTNAAIKAGIPIPLLKRHAPINASDSATQAFATQEGEGAGWVTEVYVTPQGTLGWKADNVPDDVVKAVQSGTLKFTSPEFREHYSSEKEGAYEGPIIRHMAFTPLPGNPHQSSIDVIAMSEQGCFQFSEADYEGPITLIDPSQYSEKKEHPAVSFLRKQATGQSAKHDYEVVNDPNASNVHMVLNHTKKQAHVVYLPGASALLPDNKDGDFETLHGKDYETETGYHDAVKKYSRRSQHSEEQFGEKPYKVFNNGGAGYSVKHKNSKRYLAFFKSNGKSYWSPNRDDAATYGSREEAHENASGGLKDHDYQVDQYSEEGLTDWGKEAARLSKMSRKELHDHVVSLGGDPKFMNTTTKERMIQAVSRMTAHKYDQDGFTKKSSQHTEQEPLQFTEFHNWKKAAEDNDCVIVTSRIQGAKQFHEALKNNSVVGRYDFNKGTLNVSQHAEENTHATWTTSNLDSWKTQAEAAGLTTKKLPHYSGNYDHYVAKDSEGNHLGSFDPTTKAGHLKLGMDTWDRSRSQHAEGMKVASPKVPKPNIAIPSIPTVNTTSLTQKDKIKKGLQPKPVQYTEQSSSRKKFRGILSDAGYRYSHGFTSPAIGTKSEQYGRNQDSRNDGGHVVIINNDGSWSHAHKGVVEEDYGHQSLKEHLSKIHGSQYSENEDGDENLLDNESSTQDDPLIDDPEIDGDEGDDLNFFDDNESVDEDSEDDEDIDENGEDEMDEEDDTEEMKNSDSEQFAEKKLSDSHITVMSGNTDYFTGKPTHTVATGLPDKTQGKNKWEVSHSGLNIHHVKIGGKKKHTFVVPTVNGKPSQEAGWGYAGHKSPSNVLDHYKRMVKNNDIPLQESGNDDWDDEYDENQYSEQFAEGLTNIPSHRSSLFKSLVAKYGGRVFGKNKPGWRGLGSYKTNFSVPEHLKEQFHTAARAAGFKIGDHYDMNSQHSESGKTHSVREARHHFFDIEPQDEGVHTIEHNGNQFVGTPRQIRQHLHQVRDQDTPNTVKILGVSQHAEAGMMHSIAKKMGWKNVKKDMGPEAPSGNTYEHLDHLHTLHVNEQSGKWHLTDSSGKKVMRGVRQNLDKALDHVSVHGGRDSYQTGGRVVNAAKIKKSSQHAEEDENEVEGEEEEISTEVAQPPVNLDMPPIMVDPAKTQAILAGLAAKDIILPSNFNFADPASIDILLAALNTNLKTEQTNDMEKMAEQQNQQEVPVMDAPMQYGENPAKKSLSLKAKIRDLNDSDDDHINPVVEGRFKTRKPKYVVKTGINDGSVATHLHIHHHKGNTLVETVGESQNDMPYKLSGVHSPKDVLKHYLHNATGPNSQFGEQKETEQFAEAGYMHRAAKASGWKRQPGGDESIDQIDGNVYTHSKYPNHRLHIHEADRRWRIYDDGMDVMHGKHKDIDSGLRVFASKGGIEFGDAIQHGKSFDHSKTSKQYSEDKGSFPSNAENILKAHGYNSIPSKKSNRKVYGHPDKSHVFSIDHNEIGVWRHIGQSGTEKLGRGEDELKKYLGSINSQHSEEKLPEAARKRIEELEKQNQQFQEREKQSLVNAARFGAEAAITSAKIPTSVKKELLGSLKTTQFNENGVVPMFTAAQVAQFIEKAVPNHLRFDEESTTVVPGPTVTVATEVSGGKKEVRGASSEQFFEKGEVVSMTPERANEIVSELIPQHGRGAPVPVMSVGASTAQYNQQNPNNMMK